LKSVTFVSTTEFTVERNHMNVLFVANDLLNQVTLLCTAEFTVERNRLNVHHTMKVLGSHVTFVRRNLAARFTLLDMYFTIKV